jgi:hypothetical protein
MRCTDANRLRHQFRRRIKPAAAFKTQVAKKMGSRPFRKVCIPSHSIFVQGKIEWPCFGRCNNEYFAREKLDRHSE